MGNREARPGIPKPLILAEPNRMTENERTRLFTRLKAYFNKSNFSQHTLADSMEKSTGYISNLFSGQSEMTVKDMVFICRSVDKDPVEFLKEVLEKRDYNENSELENLMEDMQDDELQQLQQVLSTTQNILAKVIRRRKQNK